ncbi:MAG: helicase-related protein [Acidimicrobiales bacterium]
MKFSDLTTGSRAHGLAGNGAVEVILVEIHGDNVATVTWRDANGQTDSRLVYEEDLAGLKVEVAGRNWTFDADAERFLLASEARRLSMAHLFDPLLAVNASAIDPLPHQIRAVYGEMLNRLPLRYLLADDPGAGKTIMAGLLIKELMLRGDLHRCLIVAPGNLVEQWQDELGERFGLEFFILTNQDIEASRIGNPFGDRNLRIARLDHLARNEELVAKARSVEWDLVVVDEAHKMSASYYGNELKRTKRYILGEALGRATRNLLLMTATPHSGHEDQFQPFMALIDPDRFAGKPQDNHGVDVSDIMRRMLKEDLLRFDGTPLFTERRAYTVNYILSDLEARLYEKVTNYVTDEMNRADRLGEGQGRRRNTVGFALTVLQRRLASSPASILRSLERRQERLMARLEEAQQGNQTVLAAGPEMSDEEIDDFDDLPDEEREELEDELVDEATAAATVAELEAEIQTLIGLVKLAVEVRRSDTDKKWEELRGLLTEDPEMRDADGKRRKVIIFTEYKDTLNYLAERLRNHLGRDEAVVVIDGSTKRKDRKNRQESFTVDPDVTFLVATDAAGEGINLQRANLLVNYDLPWNPNRIEQRFGRIHRIGQTEVCHMWNLVATETREGDVYNRLLLKLDQERLSLGGRVFDVLGQVFAGDELKRLLIEAVRYGNQPEVKARLDRVIDEHVSDGLREVLAEQALHSQMMSLADVEEIRLDMERAAARRLQPHFIRLFFEQAFERIGGRTTRREEGRYEINHVPASARDREGRGGTGVSVQRKYERVTFERERMLVPGRPPAALIAPGRPLFDAVLGLTLERDGSLLEQGAVLVDDADQGDEPRLLIYLEHSITDGRTTTSGRAKTVSRRFQFVFMDSQGQTTGTEGAPYLDYRAATPDEMATVEGLRTEDWVRNDVEKRAVDYAISQLAPEHLAQVRSRTIARVDKTEQKVRERLLRVIADWDNRANRFAQQEASGRQPKMNAQAARDRAAEFDSRLQRRLAELDRERQVAPQRPLVIGAALVVPAGLLRRLAGNADPQAAQFARETQRIERIAVDAVKEAETALGRKPREMPHNNPGYDIESKAGWGELLFVEVKGRVVGARTVTITRNEILTGLNKGDHFVLAMVRVAADDSSEVRYLYDPFVGRDDALTGVASVNYEFDHFWERAVTPR